MRIKITKIGDIEEVPQFKVGDIFDVYCLSPGLAEHIVMPSGHIYWLVDMRRAGDEWSVLLCD